MSYSKEKKKFLVKQYEQGKPVAVISKPMGSQRAVFIAGFENTIPFHHLNRYRVVKMEL